MKKRRPKIEQSVSVGLDEIAPEYDFSNSQPNRYASQFTTGSVVVVLEPDVAALFPNAESVNEALRALGGLIQKHRGNP